MAQLFRTAIVGCGKIANAHAQAILASPMTELTALVDPAADRAQALAARYGVAPRIATAIDDVLPHVDGVVIATPNFTHASLAVTCVQRGVATLIEKPLAVSAAEGERICEAAEAAGVMVAVGYVTRFRDNVRLMARLLRDGAFGDVRRFAYQFGSRGGWAPVSGYNLDRAASGGGVLVVTGTHFLDRMLDLFGYPSSLQLADDSDGGPEANAVATFTFDRERGPVRGMARFSKSVALDAGLVVETASGVVILKDRPDAPVTFRPHDDPSVEQLFVPRASPDSGRSEFVRQLEDFVESARTARTPHVSGRQGLQSMRLIEDLYRHRVPLAPAAGSVSLGSR
jgi:predicted dehydrogenase